MNPQNLLIGYFENPDNRAVFYNAAERAKVDYATSKAPEENVLRHLQSFEGLLANAAKVMIVSDYADEETAEALSLMQSQTEGQICMVAIGPAVKGQQEKIGQAIQNLMVD